MSQELNIIGDIAGQYKTLEALLRKMPQSAIPFSVGDMVDRGPQSKDVLYFFKENGQAILGNHEHMMLTEYDYATKDVFSYYDTGVWLQNGGTKTLLSFLGEDKKEHILDIEEMFYLYGEAFNLDPIYQPRLDKATKEYKEYLCQLPYDIMEWIALLPLYKSTPDLIISHAPIRPDYAFEKVLDIGKFYGKNTDDCIIWNRGTPRRIEGKTQVHGHNSYRKPQYFQDKQGTFAIGIDTSRENILTGLHYPSMQIYEQEFL